MASRKLNRKYPHLTAYLEAHKTNPIRQRVESAMSGGCLATLVAVPLFGSIFGFVAMQLARVPVAFVPGAVVGGIVTLIVGLSILARQAKTLQTPRTSEEALAVKAFESSEHFRKLDGDKKLHRWLDPVAGQLLEAGSYHWKRVQDALASPFWTSTELPNHWTALRQRSLEAADSAMAELVVLCSGCVGEPGRSRDDDLKDVIEDFADLDITDALQGLSRMFTNGHQDYSFQSPESRIVFEPGRQIAERIKELADQVESATQRVRAETTPIPQGAYATESLDLLIGEFKAIQQAEEELRQTH